MALAYYLRSGKTWDASIGLCSAHGKKHVFKTATKNIWKDNRANSSIHLTCGTCRLLLVLLVRPEDVLDSMTTRNILDDANADTLLTGHIQQYQEG